MITTRSVVGSLALFGVCWFGGWLTAAEWGAVTLQGSQFQVDMPGTPKVRYDKEERDGKLDIMEIHYAVFNQTIFMANVSPAPDRASLHAAAQGFKDGYSTATVVKQNDFTVGTNPCRELLIEERQQGLHIHWRGCVIDKQLAQQVVITKLKGPSPDIERFFQSLKRVQK